MYLILITRAHKKPNKNNKLERFDNRKNKLMTQIMILMKNQFRPKNNKIKTKKSLRNKLKSLLQVKKMMNKDQELILMIKDQ